MSNRPAPTAERPAPTTERPAPTAERPVPTQRDAPPSNRSADQPPVTPTRSETVDAPRTAPPEPTRDSGAPPPEASQAPAPPPVAPETPQAQPEPRSTELDEARADVSESSRAEDSRPSGADVADVDATVTLDSEEATATATPGDAADVGAVVDLATEPDLVAESVDGSASAGAEVAPESTLPDVGVPDAAQPEIAEDERLQDYDPANNIDDIVEQRLDQTPHDFTPDDTLGGGPSAPSEGPGPDFDADDPFGVDIEPPQPDLNGVSDDPFSLDVSPPAMGTPNAGDQDIIPDGRGGYTVLDDGGTDYQVVKHDDGYEFFAFNDDDDNPLLGEEDRLSAKEIERLTGVNPNDVGGSGGGAAGGDGGGVQTEMDRLEMRLHQVIDWAFGDGDDSEKDGDYDPDSVNVAPHEIDTDDPNFQHKVSERDGAITWGDHDSGLDGSGAAEYDGVDYGGPVEEVDIPIAEAADAIYGNPFDQPDVDPVEHDDGVEALMIE